MPNTNDADQGDSHFRKAEGPLFSIVEKTIPKVKEDTVIFYDSITNGHHIDYMESLVLSRKRYRDGKVVLVTSHEIKDRLIEYANELGSDVTFDFLSPSEVEHLNNSKGTNQRGRRELNVLAPRLAKWNCSSLVLLHVNSMQFVLRSQLGNGDLSIRGILLNPNTHRTIRYRWKHSLRVFTRNIRRNIALWSMLSNNQVKSVYILNDPSAVDFLNKKFQRNDTFKVIYDPIPPGVYEYDCEPISTEKSPRETVKFIMCGELSPRKGILETLEVLEEQGDSLIGKIQLTIIGSYNHHVDYKRKCDEVIERINRETENIEINVTEHRVSYKTLLEEVIDSDFLLLPYLGFQGSSGLIGYACKAKTPVISCEEGLIGESIKQFELGTTVNPRNHGDFINAFNEAIKGKVNMNMMNAEEYLKRSNPMDFIAMLKA